MDDTGNSHLAGPLANTAAIKTIIYWISTVVLAGLMIVLVVFIMEELHFETMVMVAEIISILITMELNRRDKTQIAGGILAASLTIMITVLAMIGEGIYDIAVMAYPGILIIASLILRRNTTIYLAIFTIICVGWLVFGSTLGYYQPHFPEQIYSRQFFITATILIVTAYAVQILSGTIRSNAISIQHELDERKKMEKALADAEDLYRNMVERTSVITYRDTAEPESKTIYISPQIRDLLGYSQGEWRDDPKLWTKITHPDDLESVRLMINDCLETGERTICEYRMVSKNGDWIWFRDESVLIKDEDGNPQYIHGVLIEITERKVAEQKVHQREAILSAVAATAQLLLKTQNWRQEINTILKLLGDATGASHVYIFENHLGTQGELLSSQKYEWASSNAIPELDNPDYQDTPLFPIVPGLEDWFFNLNHGKPFYGSKNQYPEYWESVFDKRGLKTLLDVPIFVDGNWWGIIGFDDFVEQMPWSQAEIDALFAAAGNLGTAIERQQVDEALRASEEKFQNAFHHTYVSMAISRTSDHTLLDVNESFCKVTGYSRDEAIGKRAGRDLRIWVHQEDRNFVIDMLEQQGYLDEHRAEFRRKNGEIGIGLLSAVNVNIAGENCQFYTFYDISKIDQLMNELKSTNEELQNFTYTVSHDLKAPLVTISGFMSYLEQDAKRGDIQRMSKDVQRINEAVTKMQRLLNELLELSRIGRLMNTPEETPFVEIVEDALRLVEGRLASRQVRVQVEANLPTVYVDRARMVEVIQNLADNAAKFMGEQSNPLLEIGLKNADGKPVFFVRDNGIGVEPDQQERVFGLFNKLDTNTEGTGIGLALVKRIVEVHGGNIWLESEGKGTGSTFYFTLADPRERDI